MYQKNVYRSSLKFSGWIFAIGMAGFRVDIRHRGAVVFYIIHSLTKVLVQSRKIRAKGKNPFPEK
jgi:hypothetical protein